MGNLDALRTILKPGGSLYFKRNSPDEGMTKSNIIIRNSDDSFMDESGRHGYPLTKNNFDALQIKMKGWMPLEARKMAEAIQPLQYSDDIIIKNFKKEVLRRAKRYYKNFGFSNVEFYGGVYGFKLTKISAATVNLIAMKQHEISRNLETPASLILKENIKDEYIEKDFKSFLERIRLIRMVCKEWSILVDREFMHHAMTLACEQICPEFLNAKLIYRRNTDIAENQTYREVEFDGEFYTTLSDPSDKDIIELNISNLWNPLGGTFPLSKCGNADQCLTISTGYRKEKKSKNANKKEIWLTPRFLVEKELQTTAGHFKNLFPNDWLERIPVGIIWTWGGEDNMHRYEYQTKLKMDILSSFTLEENYNFFAENLDNKIAAAIAPCNYFANDFEMEEMSKFTLRM